MKNLILASTILLAILPTFSSHAQVSTQDPAGPSATTPTPPAPGQAPAAPRDPNAGVFAQAQELGAPMVAVKKAFQLSRTSTYDRKDVFAVFDISQPSKNKRFFVIDLKAGKVTSYFVAHGRGNGDNFKATKFRGFQADHNMTPLGPLRTASAPQDMEHYRSIKDQYTGEMYNGGLTLWLEGVASYNRYINNARDERGSKVVWIVHPAWYVSEGYRKANPNALGRSLGCIALDPRLNNVVVKKMSGGALIYVTVGDQPIEKFL